MKFTQPIAVILLLLSACLHLGCDSIPSLDQRQQATPFAWSDRPGDRLDLFFNGRPMLRYMYAYDTSTAESREATYKPFHHVMSPTGRQPITKGPGGLYTHHRGMMVGWMKLMHAGKAYDFWTMGRGDTQVHRAFVEQSTSPDAATSAARIDWVTADGLTLIEETRRVTVRRPDAAAYFVADYEIDLKAVSGQVYLDGDPEHAGFQFRPTNDLAEQAEDGRGEAIYTFHKDYIDPTVHPNLPWVVMSFNFDGRAYHVQHMTHPDDPRPWTYSAYRDYGRFGSYFKETIGAGETLTIKYRVRVVEGEAPTRDAWQGAYDAYVVGE